MNHGHEKSLGGQAPLDLLRQQQYESAFINASIPWPEEVSYIFVAGASASGKTTLAERVRGVPGIEQLYQFAERATERQQREKDDLVENVRFGVEPDEWALTVDEGFTVQLQKPSDNGVETYYFHYANDGRVPIFPANLGVLQFPGHIFPQNILESSLIIGVEAPREVREQRFKERSKDIMYGRPDEANFRLKDVGDLVVRNSHMTLSNWGELEAAAPCDLQRILLDLSGSLEFKPAPQPMHTVDGRNGFPEPNSRDFYLGAMNQLEGVEEFITKLQEMLRRSSSPGEQDKRTLDRYIHVATRLSMPDARIYVGEERHGQAKNALTSMLGLTAQLGTNKDPLNIGSFTRE